MKKELRFLMLIMAVTFTYIKLEKYIGILIFAILIGLFMRHMYKTFKNIKSLKNKLVIFSFIFLVLLFVYLIDNALTLESNLLIKYYSIGSYICFLMSQIIYLESYMFIKKISKKDSLKYYREFSKDISPIQVSYLMNNQIEGKKDLTAAILSIANKGHIKIMENEILFEEKTTKEILTKDEIYVYQWLTKKDYTIFNTKELTIEVEKELIDKNYIQNEKKVSALKELGKIIELISGILIATLIITLGLAIFIENDNTGLLLAMTFFYTLIISITFIIIIFIFSKRLTNFGISEHTVEGIEEFMKWRKFKKFLEEFTLIKNKSLEYNVLLEEYFVYAVALNINKNYTLKEIEKTVFY